MVYLSIYLMLHITFSKYDYVIVHKAIYLHVLVSQQIHVIVISIAIFKHKYMLMCNHVYPHKHIMLCL